MSERQVQRGRGRGSSTSGRPQSCRGRGSSTSGRSQSCRGRGSSTSGRSQSCRSRGSSTQSDTADLVFQKQSAPPAPSGSRGKRDYRDTRTPQTVIYDRQSASQTLKPDFSNRSKVKSRSSFDADSDKYSQCDDQWKAQKLVSSESPSASKTVQPNDTVGARLLMDIERANKLKKNKVTKSSNEFNKLRNHIVDQMNQLTLPITWESQSAGSYYDKTKINEPDQFDLVLYAKIKCSIGCERSAKTRGYCKLCPDNPEFFEHMIEGNYLCPKKFRDFVFEKMNEAIDHTNSPINRRLKRVLKTPDCPAFSLEYDIGSGNKLDVDLVPAIKMEGWPDISNWTPPEWITYKREELKQSYECVAKLHPTVTDQPLWHLSFTKTSQLIWKHADGKGEGGKTCRKDVLKFFKSLLEKLKEEKSYIEHISNHQLRQCLLSAYERWPKDEQWASTEKFARIRDVQEMIINIFQSKRLDLYFITGYNLLRNVPNSEIQAFVKHLQEITI